VLRVLAEMMPNLRLATDRLDWGHSLLARGLVSLPVKFSARG
jgi:cytochrome P450